jgi:NAD+ diphosphatase
MHRPDNRINPLAGPYLDRRAHERELDDWLELARNDAATRYLVCHRTTQLVALDGGPAALLLDAAAAAAPTLLADDAVLLGWFRGARCVLIHTDAPDRYTNQGRFEELRPLVPALASDEAALLAYARAMSYWRLRHRYCGNCGAATRALKAGHVLRCTNNDCGAEVFPRIDPAIIVLVTDAAGENAMLGRQAAWPPDRYSTIAGFVEPGESLEDAVAREVAEETGVALTAVRYESSQPWPFPASLMLGFQAVAASGAKPRGIGELEHARWFSRAEISRGTPLLPPPASISYRLIESWFDAGARVPLAQCPGVGAWTQPPRSR